MGASETATIKKKKKKKISSSISYLKSFHVETIKNTIGIQKAHMFHIFAIYTAAIRKKEQKKKRDRKSHILISYPSSIKETLDKICI